MILLARHGETDHNIPPQRVQGWVDIPLNERGREQARALAGAMREREVAAVYTSHLARARETAEIVAAELGLPVAVDERLAESNRGTWEGRLMTEIEQEEPDAWRAWRAAGGSFRFPDGESLREHADRVSAALDEIARGPLPALVVCHGGTIRAAFAVRHERGLEAFHELEVPNATPLELPAPSHRRAV